MKFIKISLMFLTHIFLNGCFQSSALIGPGLTIASTGNIVQATLQYGANEVIKKETGKGALTLVKDVVEKDSKKRKFDRDFKKMVKNRIQNVRKKILVD